MLPGRLAILRAMVLMNCVATRRTVCASFVNSWPQ